MITRGWLRAGISILVLFANSISGARADGPELQRGIDALHAGNAKLAIKLLTTELETPPRSSVDLARALYFRAKAHLADRQTARAMADANAALWLRKLSPSEIADAENIKAQVLKSAGVPSAPPTIASTAAAPVTPTPSAPDPVPPKEAGGKLPEKAEPDHGPAARPMPTWPTANVKPIDLPPLASTRAPLATQAALPAPRQHAPAWSTAAIQREDLPQVAVPSNTSPIAEPSRESRVETGSIAVSKAPPGPQAALAAPQPPVSAIQPPSAAGPASVSPPVVKSTRCRGARHSTKSRFLAGHLGNDRHVLSIAAFARGSRYRPGQGVRAQLSRQDPPSQSGASGPPRRHSGDDHGLPGGRDTTKPIMRLGRLRFYCTATIPIC